MPLDYAKRFAELISEAPDVASDYAVQLYDVPFAHAVADELVQMGFQTEVTVTGLLRVHVPEGHPKAKPTKDSSDQIWSRKPEDRSTSWTYPRAILAGLRQPRVFMALT